MNRKELDVEKTQPAAPKKPIATLLLVFDLINYQMVLSRTLTINVRETNKAAHEETLQKIIASLANVPPSRRLDLLLHHYPLLELRKYLPYSGSKYPNSVHKRLGLDKTSPLSHVLTSSFEGATMFMKLLFQTVRHNNGDEAVTLKLINVYFDTLQRVTINLSAELAFLRELNEQAGEPGKEALQNFLMRSRTSEITGPNFIKHIVGQKPSRGDVLLEAVLSNLLPAKLWALESNAKEILKKEVLNLNDNEKKLALLREALEQVDSPLYEFFHTKRGLKQPSINTGTLKELKEAYDALLSSKDELLSTEHSPVPAPTPMQPKIKTKSVFNMFKEFVNPQQQGPQAWQDGKEKDKDADRSSSFEI